MRSAYTPPHYSDAGADSFGQPALVQAAEAAVQPPQVCITAAMLRTGFYNDSVAAGTISAASRAHARLAARVESLYTIVTESVQ